MGSMQEGGYGMINYFKTLWELRFGNEEGQTMIEYALLVALIAIVVIAALTILGPQIGNKFNSIGNNL